jgi:ketosteroid isomerase-like protein
MITRTASLALLISTCVFILSCGGAPATNTPSNANSTNTPAASPASSYTAPGSSPTATIRQWRDALRKKDVDAFVSTYAQADVDLMKENAQKDGESLNAWVKHGYFNNPNYRDMFPPVLEVSNEQINGDTATVNMKNARGRVKTVFITYDGNGIYGQARIYFVKENGVWKLSPKAAPPLTKEEQEKLDQELLDDMPLDEEP